MRRVREKIERSEERGESRAQERNGVRGQEGEPEKRTRERSLRKKLERGT